MTWDADAQRPQHVADLNEHVRHTSWACLWAGASRIPFNKLLGPQSAAEVSPAFGGDLYHRTFECLPGFGLGLTCLV